MGGSQPVRHGPVSPAGEGLRLDERSPSSRHRDRRDRVLAGAAVVVLMTGLALAFSGQARGLARAFVVNGWRIPIDGTASAVGSPAGGIRREAAETPPPTLHWVPSPDASWQWLPAGPADSRHSVDVYDLPLATTAPARLADVHARGAHAVCWLPIGTVSAKDPNLRDLDPTLLGKPVPGHPDERFLDIRRLDDLKPFVSARLDDCWAKGFDGVDAAGLDAYLTAGEEGIGFPVGYADALALTTAVAGLGHGRGLAVGLHAGPTAAPLDTFVAAVEPITDFVVLEQCVTARSGCGAFTRYPQHGKAALHLEYLQDYPGATVANPRKALSRACPAVASLGFSTILKDGSGTDAAWRQPCP